MPKDEDIALEDMAIGADGFLKEFPKEIRNSFTDQQIAAIKHACHRVKRSVDARVTLPLPWGRRYFVLLSGNERETPEGQRPKRQLPPLSKMAKVAVTLIYIGMIGFLTVNGLQIYDEVVSNLLQ